MKNVRYAVVAWLWAWGACLQAQDYTFATLDEDTGLPSNNVNGVCIDADGYVWFATDGGLRRYDGLNYRLFTRNASDHFSLTRTQMGEVTIAPNGLFWMARLYGFAAYSPFSGGFRTFAPEFTVQKKITIDCVAADSSGGIWGGTLEGLVYKKKDETSFAFIPTPAPVNCITVLKNGEVWFGTEGKGPYKLSGGVPVAVFTDTTGKNGVDLDDIDRISVIVEDAGGRIWLLGSDVVSYEPGKWAVHENVIQDDAGRKSGYFITAGAAGPDGALWIGTTDNGVVVYYPERKEIRRLKHDPDNTRSLCNNQVKKIAVDRTGVAWVVTGIGVSKVAPRLKKFHTLQNKPNNVASLTDNYIKAVCENAKGQIVVAALNGVSVYDPQKNVVERLNKERYPFVEDLFGTTFLYGDHRGAIWVGLGLGVVEWTATGAKEHLGRTALAAAVEDTFEKCMWFFGDDSLLFRYKANRWDKFKFDKLGLERWPEVRCMAVMPDGSLWIGTDKGAIRRTQDGVYRRFTATDGMADETITHLLPTPGGLWLGTRNGLHLFKDERFFVFGRSSGLAGANIASILPGDGEELWVAHEKGLTRWNPRLRSGAHYNHEHGLQSNVFHDGVAARDRKGRLYFGGPNGLNFFYPHEIVQSAFPAFPAIVKFYIDDKETLADSSIFYKNRIYLEYNQSSIGFSLAAVNYFNPVNNKIRYRMVGVDRDWVQIRNVEGFIVRYPNLEPGDYVFEVIAANEDGVFSDKVRRMHIKIYPPFWDTLWFYVVEVLFLVTLLFTAHYLRRTRKRSRLATVFTFATLILIFEVISLVIESYLDNYSYGIPLIKLGLNVSLAVMLNPVEKLTNRFLGGPEEIEKY